MLKQTDSNPRPNWYRIWRRGPHSRYPYPQSSTRTIRVPEAWMEMSVEGADNATLAYCAAKGIRYQSYGAVWGCSFGAPAVVAAAAAHGMSPAQVQIRSLYVDLLKPTFRSICRIKRTNVGAGVYAGRSTRGRSWRRGWAPI